MTRLILTLSLILALAACQSAEERAEGHYQSALELLAEGDLARASVEFRNVFELNGLHTEARRTFAQALREDGQGQAAFGQYLRLAEQLPEDVELRIVLAEMSLENQNWTALRLHGGRALELVPEEIRDDPRLDMIDVTLQYAQALEDDNPSDRRDAAQTAGDVLEAIPGNLPLLRLLVDNALREGDSETALTLVESALVENPDNRDLQNTRLSLLAEAGDAAGLLAQLEEMIQRFPEDDELVATLLRFHISRGDLDLAEAFLRDQISATSDVERAASLRAGLVQFLIQAEGGEAALEEVNSLIAAFPDDMRYRMMRSTIRFADGDRDAAITELESLVETTEAPGPLNDARVALAQMYGATDNPVGARRLIGEVLESDGAHVAALKMEANWLIDEDRADEAVAALRRALDEAPGDADAMTLMARAHQRSGNHELSRDFLALAFEASGSAPAETIRYADNLAQDDLFLAAEEALIAALRLQPGDLSLLDRLGRIYVAMEDWPRVEQVEDTVRRQDTEQGTRLANGLRAARLAGRGELEDAIGFLQELAEGDEEDGLRAQIAVVRALLADGQVQEALAFTQEAVANTPDNAPLLMTRAAAETAAGEGDAAIATYEEVLALVPDFERAWIELIRARFAQGDTDEARETLDRALEALPDGLNLLWAQASFLEQAGDIDGAIAIYERLYEDLADSAVVANNLASLISTYRTDEASLERAYAIARRLRGTEVPPLMDTYGWIAFRRGDIEEARPYLEGAAQAIPEDALVQYHYGMLLAAEGAREAAIAQLTRALEIAGPEDTRAQFEEARAELERLQSEPAATDTQ